MEALAETLDLKLIIEGPQPNLSRTSWLLSQTRFTVKFKGRNVSVGVLDFVDGGGHVIGVCPDRSGHVVGDYGICSAWDSCGRVYELQPVIHVDVGSVGIIFSSEREDDIPVGKPRGAMQR